MNASGNDQNGSGSKGTGQISWGTKAGYIGTGILIGLVIYPFVRKAVSKIQPKMDKVFDDLTGKAEDLAERAADLLAKAKQNLRNADSEEHEHAHSQLHGESSRKSAMK